MATYEIQSPNGEVYEIEGPDDADPSAIIGQITGMQKPAAQAAPEPKYDPSEGGGTLQFGPLDTGIPTPQGVDRFLAGAGKAFTDLGRGVKQRAVQVAEASGLLPAPIESLVTGQSRSDKFEQEEEERRRLDAPLTNTGAGKAGQITGAIAATLPALLIPGANTVAGAGAVGAVYGALQPTVNNREIVANTAIGGAAGAGGQAIGQRISQFAANKIAQRSANASSAEAQNAVRDATLAESRKVGYVLPPSTTNPTAVNRAVESVSGKAQTQQSAAVRNQQITNRLVREEFGLPKNAPLTKDSLNAIRSREGQVYKEVSSAGRISTDEQYLDDLVKISKEVDDIAKDFPDLNLGANKDIRSMVNSLLKDDYDSNAAVELVKQLRRDANGNLSGAAAADPTKKALGRAQREAAATVEDLLIRNLESQGKGALAKRFDEARQTIAKTYSVEAALNPGTGNVVASQLGNQLRRGKPLSGNLATVAKFAQAFPKAAEEIRTSPGVSALDAVVAGAGGTTLNPALFALPAVRIGTREALLTGVGQKLAKPSYTPSSTGTSALKLLQQSKYAALPSATYATQE